ncbi:MAG TPA: type I glyceraldehyde-3-phosphate dehydrogenase [Bacteroidia bacterium]|nr:type I glyceraldehyde-3-phosphate dehydrogenase [Bacteroidia bacterium]
MKKKIRVAINGFGRIGRIALRKFLEQESIEVVAVNDLTDSKTLAHLFRYDSIHGKFKGTVSSDPGSITINGNRIQVTAEKDPLLLPWKQLQIDVVLESTGRFTRSEDAGKHLTAGARKVIISAPAKDNVKTIVLGVNDDQLSAEDTILSNASCTTNNVAPMIKIIDTLWGIENAYITTVHAYTGDQNLHDGPHKDLRRARAAACSIIPTTTGAAKAVTEVFPHLKGKCGGAGIRVPVPDGSLTDITCTVKKEVTVEELNSAFKKYAEGSMKGILEYTEDPIVSIDIVGNTHSCIFDAQLTSVLGRMVKVVGWYDNEMGYSSRLAELVCKIG